MLISPKYKFIFFKSKKCAGTSIQKTLLKNCTTAALSTGSWNQITKEIEYESRNNTYYDSDSLEIVERFHPEDTIMAWFDFFNHDSNRVCRNMSAYMAKVVPMVNTMLEEKK